MKSMRGILVSEFGAPEVLRIVSNIPLPKPRANEVLINVKAAGINPVDTYIRSGIYANKPTLPYTPGKDGSGIVHEIGEHVTKVKTGDRVWFFGSSTGSCAQYCLCQEDNIGYLPESHSYEEGAMIGTPYATAYRALVTKAKFKPGETVLIHGATGGVGTAGIQICKKIGAHVIGTAGSQDGIQLLKSLAVNKVYNHNSDSYLQDIKENEKVNVILEMLANKNLEKDLGIIEAQGRIAIIGNRGSLDFNPRLIMATEAHIFGVMLFKMTNEEKEEKIRFLNDGLNAGWIKPPLWKAFSLENTCHAHEEIINNKGSRGQMVIQIE